MESVIEASLKDWREREQRYEKLFSPAVLKSREFLKEKLKHYDELRAKAMANPLSQDRMAMQALNLERKQLARQVYPNIFRRLLERAFSNYRVSKGITREQEQSHTNMESVRAAMDKAGLGNHFYQVQAQMKQGNREFSLPVSYQVNEHERMQLQLHFKRDEKGAYQMGNYKATLHSELEKGKPRQHTFEAAGNEIINTDRAYNLLAGRAILDEKSGAWRQFDFNDKDANGNYHVRHFNESYGYKPENTIASLPLKNAEERDSLLQKLSHGEKVITAFLIAGKEHNVSLAADPLKKDIAIYNTAGQKVTMDELKVGNRNKEAAGNVKQLQPKLDQAISKSKSLKI